MSEQRPGNEERDSAIQDALIEAGTFGDLSGLIEFLKAGCVNQNLLDGVAAILSGLQSNPRHQQAVARRYRNFERRLEVLEAFERRTGDAGFGIVVDNPQSSEDLAWELAEKFGFKDARQVYNILKTPWEMDPPDWSKGGR